MQNPLRWHPTGMTWWNEKKIVLGRYSGGVTILDVEEEFESNTLGDSAEFFALGFKMSQRLENGFFLLEAGKPVKAAEDTDDSAAAVEEGDEDDDDEDEEAGLLSRAMTYITGQKRKQESSPLGPPRQALRLLFFQRTSPEELYQKKIDDQEYGEAIMLARHYGLDCDYVYERQWRLSKHDMHAVMDYLSKIKSRDVVLKECQTVVPDSAEAMEGLLAFGIRTCGEEDAEVKKKLEKYQKRLHIYRDVLDAQSANSRAEGESHFDPKKFVSFR